MASTGSDQQGEDEDAMRAARQPDAPEFRSMLGPAAADLDVVLPLEHPLRLFLAEHALMRRLADRLDDHCRELARRERPQTEILADLHGTALELRTASRAHQEREEKALFRALRERGVHGAPEVLEIEHHDFEALETEVVRVSGELLADPLGDPLPLYHAASSLIALSRSHIHRENEVLFPLVLELFTRADIWDEVRRVSAQIPSSTKENRP